MIEKPLLNVAVAGVDSLEIVESLDPFDLGELNLSSFGQRSLLKSKLIEWKEYRKHTVIPTSICESPYTALAAAATGISEYDVAR